MSETADIKPGCVTIVTQTRVVPGKEAEFARWQQVIGEAAAEFSGFIEQTIMPPSPPAQIDWVILQRFFSAEKAAAWLNSPRRLELLKPVLPIIIGCDDINLVPDGAAGALPAPVSAVISTRVKPGCETLYRTWEHKIAAAQTRARGFQGYRFEPPIPGMQQNWLAIVRFDSEANMQAWLDSPERLALIKEAEPFTEEFHARTVRTGFDQWFRVNAEAAPPSAWKMNMLVLMMLYPVVSLLGMWFQKPLLTDRGVPVWLSLFIANGATVLLLSYLVPWASRRFKWWLTPRGAVARINFVGAALVIALYGLSLLVFGLYANWSSTHE